MNITYKQTLRVGIFFIFYKSYVRRRDGKEENGMGNKAM